MDNESPLPSLAGLLPDSPDDYAWREEAMEDDEALSAGAFPTNRHAAPGSGGSTASTTSTSSMPPAQCHAIGIEENDVRVLAHKFQKVAIRRDVYKSRFEDLRDRVKNLEAAFKKQDEINKQLFEQNAKLSGQNSNQQQNIKKLFEDTGELRLEVADLRRTRSSSGPST